MYCTICKNARHVTEARAAKRATRTTAATAGSAPKIKTTQDDHRVEEVWTVSQQMTGSAFATAAVSRSASGSNNLSPQIKVLVDTGNLLSIGLCVSESFFLSLGGKLADLSPPSFQTANGASEISAMHVVGDTQVFIKCSNFNNVVALPNLTTTFGTVLSLHLSRRRYDLRHYAL